MVVGDVVKCIKLSENNPENLEIGRHYQILGITLNDGNVVYSISKYPTNGNIYYTMDDKLEYVGKALHDVDVVGKTLKSIITGAGLVEGKIYTPEEFTPAECKIGSDTSFIKILIDKEPSYFFYYRFVEVDKDEVEFEEYFDNLVEDTELVSPDMLNHPNHYTFSEKFEVIDVIEEATKNLKGMEAVCVGHILRYILRYPYKNGLEDVKKCQFYTNKLVDILEGKEE